MKKHKRMGLMIGAALLQIGYLGNLESVIAQDVTASAQPSETMPTSISPATAEVTRLAQSGVSDEVVIAFVKQSSARLELSEETIIYLKDLGLAPEVIAAMIEHDGALPAGSSPAGPPVELALTSEPGSTVTPEAVPAAYETNSPADVNYFYTQLAPYGTWASVEGVGWCWQPHCYSFRPGWRPYCHGGHWVYTDYGWYWQSDYSWGWAPFHYGRWHHHERCGWVWCPGREWAPAWVTWRVGNGHCGWAPLPPNSVYVIGSGWRHKGTYYKDDCDFGLQSHHFTFVATKDFTSHELGRQRLAETDVRNVYNSTTVHNGGMTANNRVLMNNGVPVEKVSAITHTEIRKIAIRDVAPGAGGVKGTQHLEPNGSVVYRHELAAPSQPLTVVAQKVNDNHPALVHPTIAARSVQPVQVPQPTQHKGQATRRADKPGNDQSNHPKTSK
jgi:hypothetical protein